MQKFLPQFQRLATTWHRSYAMITDHRKFTTKWTVSKSGTARVEKRAQQA